MPSIGHPAERGAFLLDWDGVLADTRLNFAPLRGKYFGGNTVPLLEAAATLPEPDRTELLAEIHKVEMEGAAAATAMEGAENLIAWLPDPEGDSAYPIVTYTWIMCYKNYADANKRRVLKGVLKYGLTDGQKDSEQLGYIPLPESVVKQVIEALNNL